MKWEHELKKVEIVNKKVGEKTARVEAEFNDLAQEMQIKVAAARHRARSKESAASRASKRLRRAQVLSFRHHAL